MMNPIQCQESYVLDVKVSYREIIPLLKRFLMQKDIEPHKKSFSVAMPSAHFLFIEPHNLRDIHDNPA